MDLSAGSAPSLASSLEAMIQMSVTSTLDRQLGPAGSTLEAKIQTAVAAALDKRLSPAVVTLDNRVTPLVEKRLTNAVSTLNHRINTLVTAALEQRLGPTGSALTAQIMITAAPSSFVPFAVRQEPQALAKADVKKEINGICRVEKEKGKAQATGCEASSEKEQPTQEQSQKIGTVADKERQAQMQGLERQPLTTEPTENEQPVQKQDATKPSNATFSESADESSLSTAMPVKSNESTSHESTSKETTASASSAGKSAVSPLFANGPAREKAGARAVLEGRAGIKTVGPSSTVAKIPAKRKANRKNEANKADKPEESESSTLEKESDSKRPKRKIAKVKLNPPGYTDGHSIKFRSVSPNLTACAKHRGYPRVIDLTDFTEASDKQNLTMADIVATVLFNYDLLSLQAFMDMDAYPTFSFIRNETDPKVRSFIIERRTESNRAVGNGVWDKSFPRKAMGGG